MSDNPTPSPWFALPGQGVLVLQGRDAVAFAQAQAMNDVAALADGHWQWNGWLTPKGRVIALFALLRLDPETVWLVLPDADAQALATSLQRFVFRSKLAIAARDDLHVAGAFEAPPEAAGARFSGDPGSGIELDLGAEAGPRRLRIATIAARQDAAALQRWLAFDLGHGLPRLSPSQAGRWTPQQLSLERLSAFSVKKGCYPGQEIVARTHFLGQAKRGLALLRTPVPASEGDEVTADGTAVGNLIGTCDHLGLAVVSPHGEAALQVAGQPAETLPLGGGLGR